MLEFIWSIDPTIWVLAGFGVLLGITLLVTRKKPGLMQNDSEW